MTGQNQTGNPYLRTQPYLFTRRTAHDLDHEQKHHLDRLLQILTCRSEVLRRINTVQIQPREYVLHHASFMVPTQQRELDRIDHTDHLR